MAASSSGSPVPAWLPDWRDANQYPPAHIIALDAVEKSVIAEPSFAVLRESSLWRAIVTPLRDRAWRWQFLRRHPDYQALWAEPCDEAKVFTVMVTSNREIATQDKTRIAEFLRRHPAAVPLKALYRDEAARFGIRWVLDPSLEQIPQPIEQAFWRSPEDVMAGECFSLLSQASTPTDEQWRQWQTRRRKGMRLLVIDLNRDVHEQIQSRMKWLRVAPARGKDKQPRFTQHTKLWPEYLRILDARSAGAPWSLIGANKGLFSQKQRNTGDAAKKMHKQAVGVRDKLSLVGS